MTDVLPCSSMNIIDFEKTSNNKGKKPLKNYDTNAIGNTVALAVIQRLQKWCFQLFWLTIVCVLGCCGDLQAINNKHKTLQDVRRSIASASVINKRSRSVMELEMQLLRHLTSPQTALLRPVHSKPMKKRQLSRPPSPQLFDICEDDESEC